MTGEPRVTLESLDWEWGDAYIISYARDQWAALRRDTRRFLTAQTPDELAARIDADYATHPVPRGCDPPGTADYLDTPDEDDDLDEDGVPGRDSDSDSDRDERQGEAGAAGRAAGGVPALGDQLLTVIPGLDRPQRWCHHLPRFGRAAVRRFNAGRPEGTPGPARPGLAPGVRWLAR